MMRTILSIGILTAAAVQVQADTWTVPGDFATIQEAVDSPDVADGDVLRVGPGDFDGAALDKSLDIRGVGGARIIGGPAHGSGLSQGFRLLTGSDGASISHFTFIVDLAVMNGDSINDITISQNTFESAIQGVSNWRGSGWDISHNTFHDLRTRCGGGIAILIGDFSAGVVSDNLVSHNTITGTLRVSDGDCGGYSGTGIVLYADFRGSQLGTLQMSDNFVVHNRIDLVSDNPSLVDVVAFELTDTRDDEAFVVIFDNAIGFNDFRRSANQISVTPATLDHPVNMISRNLGDNRGHGAHPSVFRAD